MNLPYEKINNSSLLLQYPLSKQPRDRTYTKCIVYNVCAIAYCLHQHLTCIVSFILLTFNDLGNGNVLHYLCFRRFYFIYFIFSLS